jgi:prohibitin 2
MNTPQGQAAFKQFRNAMQKVRTAGNAGGGGKGSGAAGPLAGAGGLILLGGGALVLNNAIFNGMLLDMDLYGG